MRTILLALSALAFAGASPTAQEPAATTVSAPQKTWTTEHVWPLPGCIVSGRPLEPDQAKTFEAGGRTFRTCCGRCEAKIEKDPQTWVAKLDEAIASAQRGRYPMTQCASCDKPLGDKAQDLVLDETLVRLCGADCAAKAKAEPAAVVARVEAAAHAAQAKTYAWKVCVVSGEEIDAKATEVMCNGRLVRLCCTDCIDDLRKEPQKYLSKLDGQPGAADAPKAKGEHDEADEHKAKDEHKGKAPTATGKEHG